MDTITTALVLALAVVLSGWVSRALPVALPLPLVQIALGAAIATVADLGVELKPDIFFLLFLPPLLFLDGWRIPKEGLFRDATAILELSFGLVIFTVLGVGLFVHWLIPSMPLAVAFALAAVISPTDPVAVSAIAQRVPVPKRLMHILEGESLLNDASGLVCMQFAVAAALTGTFSLIGAAGTFLWLAAGGIAIGTGVTWAVTRSKNWFARTFGEDPGTQILISLLIPFGAYLLAEHFHCSGILAAVAAGITMSYAEQTGQALALTRVSRAAVWDTVQFAVKGVIFVLLGEQLPTIGAGAAKAVQETGHSDPAWLIGYVLAISAALIVLRLLWVWVSLRFTLFRAALRGEVMQRPGWRIVAVTALAGVRGAITLAGVLSLPLLMEDGLTPFPARDLAIYLAAGVIIVSLVVASIALPFLLGKLQLPPEPAREEEEDKARSLVAEAALRAVETHKRTGGDTIEDAALYADVAANIGDFYRQRIRDKTADGEGREAVRRAYQIERELRLAAIRAERVEILRLRRSRQISEEVARKFVHELDFIEARLMSA